jgi:hypothetical protein
MKHKNETSSGKKLLILKIMTLNFKYNEAAKHNFKHIIKQNSLFEITWVAMQFVVCQRQYTVFKNDDQQFVYLPIVGFVCCREAEESQRDKNMQPHFAAARATGLYARDVTALNTTV